MARVDIRAQAIEDIRKDPRLAVHFADRLKPVKAAAESTSPDHPMIGQGYRFAFRIVAGVDSQKGALARVINTDFKAGWVEFGAHAGGKTAVLRYRVLGRALVRIRQ